MKTFLTIRSQDLVQKVFWKNASPSSLYCLEDRLTGCLFNTNKINNNFKHQISTALFSSFFLKRACELCGNEISLKNNAKYYEDLACGVLEKFDEASDNFGNFANGVLLLQKIPYYKLNVLELAAEADCKKFIGKKYK